MNWLSMNVINTFNWLEFLYKQCLTRCSVFSLLLFSNFIFSCFSSCFHFLYFFIVLFCFALSFTISWLCILMAACRLHLLHKGNEGENWSSEFLSDAGSQTLPGSKILWSLRVILLNIFRNLNLLTSPKINLSWVFKEKKCVWKNCCL